MGVQNIGTAACAPAGCRDRVAGNAQTHRFLHQPGPQVESAGVRPRMPELPQYFGPDLIASPADRRAQVDPQIGRRHAIQSPESPDSLSNYPCCCTTPARMKQSERPGIRIHDIDRHAIGRGHCEENAGPVRSQPVHLTSDADARTGRRIDDGHTGPVNLATDDAGPAPECEHQRLEPFRDATRGSLT